MNYLCLGRLPVGVGRNHPREKFSPTEDDQLRKLVETYGDKDWASVAEHMKNRSVRQCRDRWVNYLSGRNTNRAWTAEEDDLLLELHGKFGSSWVTIAKQFPGRHDIAIKNRYNVLLRRSRRLKAEEKFNARTHEEEKQKAKEWVERDPISEMFMNDCVFEGLFEERYPWEEQERVSMF